MEAEQEAIREMIALRAQGKALRAIAAAAPGVSLSLSDLKAVRCALARRPVTYALLIVLLTLLWLCHAGAADTIPMGLPDDLVCKSAEPYSPCQAAREAAAELWNYAAQYRSACAKEPTYPDLVDCLSRHLWGVPFGFRKHYIPPVSTTAQPGSPEWARASDACPRPNNFVEDDNGKWSCVKD